MSQLHAPQFCIRWIINAIVLFPRRVTPNLFISNLDHADDIYLLANDETCWHAQTMPSCHTSWDKFEQGQKQNPQTLKTHSETIVVLMELV